MKNTKIQLFALTSFCAALVMLVLPTAINAQGKYANTYSKRDVSNIIAKLERSSNEFRRDFDRNLDQSSINGTREEDRLNNIVKDYERDLNVLRREFDGSNSWWESRQDVRDVMRSARSVNQMMTNLPFARQLERRWRNMRQDINKLADTYDLAELGGNFDDGNTGGGGDVPNWAVGTFTARNPQSGGNIILTINNNGSVIVNIDGRTNSATMNGTRFYNNGATSRISRTSNGIRATSPDGQVIEYYKSGGGGGWNGGNDGGGWNGGNDGNRGEVPNWAVGTFYGRNPQTGGLITLTINNNGSVTVVFENGGVNYATMYRDQLTNNGATSRITKTRNGIRATSPDGQVINYSKNRN